MPADVYKGFVKWYRLLWAECGVRGRGVVVRLSKTPPHLIADLLCQFFILNLNGGVSFCSAFRINHPTHHWRERWFLKIKKCNGLTRARGLVFKFYEAAVAWGVFFLFRVKSRVSTVEEEKIYGLYWHFFDMYDFYYIFLSMRRCRIVYCFLGDCILRIAAEKI